MRMRERLTTPACVALSVTLSVGMALAMPGAAHAQRRAEPPLNVSYPTDAALTCDQLTAEIARMEEIAGASAQNAEAARGQGQMAESVAGMAVNAAYHTGALARVPGLGMFANAAGATARRNAEARAQAEAQRIQVADQRRTLLSGIYQGRQCGLAPAPAPVAEPAPTEPAEG